MNKSEKQILNAIYDAWVDSDENLIRMDDLETETLLKRGQIIRETTDLERHGLIKILYNQDQQAYSITEKGIRRINKWFPIIEFLKIASPIAAIIAAVAAVMTLISVGTI